MKHLFPVLLGIVAAAVVYMFFFSSFTLLTPTANAIVQQPVIEPIPYTLTEQELYVMDSFDSNNAQLPFPGSENYITRNNCDGVISTAVLERYNVTPAFIRDLCRRDAANAVNDSTKCTLEREFMKEFCVAEISLRRNPDYCSEVTGSLADFCILASLYHHVSIHSGSDVVLQRCNMIRNEELAQFCRESFS